jgi:hypothetical protein
MPPVRPTLAVLAVGGVATAGGLWWAQARRRRLGA